MNCKIAVAMSGGVDSSVAAALMVEKYGKDGVIGLTMDLLGNEDVINDARDVCEQLGIKHFIVELRKQFQKEIIDDFIAEYEAGMTPNPCVRCNRLIKFGRLLEEAQKIGADKLVTGHYVRVSSIPVTPSQAGVQEKGMDSWLPPSPKASERTGTTRNDAERGELPTTRYKLLRGLDRTKDQSYFLYNLTQEQLARVEFPIGELEKTETRKLAAKYSLKTAQKTESQDICFVMTTTQEFLTGKVKAKPGNIVDSVGNILGRHNGLPFYTIGQRKGLGGGFFEVMYVTGLNVDKNEVIIGPEDELYGSGLIVENPHWVNPVEFPFHCKAKIRYQAELAECEITKKKTNSITVKFTEPQKAITSGQSVVFYQDEELLGGGIIVSTI